MKKLFKKSEQPGERIELPSLDEARNLVPASAKSPDAQRQLVFNPDEEIDENNDEDLALLNRLINDEQPPTAQAKQELPAPQPQSPATTPAGDDLDVFREIAALRTRTELAKQFDLEHVDMGELLEELHTTRAALRHARKAA